MADEKIQIQTEVDVQPSIAELKRLQKELRATTDPVEFKRLQQQIDDTKDSIAAARTGAGNFAEVLGTLPGPIGDVAGRAGGLIGTLKTFGQLKIGDIKGSFVELGNDLVDAAKGLSNLTGITKVYTVINNALAASFVRVGVGEAAAATGARAFAAALTATGIGAIVVGLGLLISALMEYSNAAEEAAEKQKEFNEARDKMARETLDVETQSLKRSTDLLLSQAKARGASAKEIFELEQQGRRLTIRAQERYYAELSSQDSEEGRKTLQNIKNLQNDIKVAENNFAAEQLATRKQNSAKNAELIKKEQDEIKKNARDAFLTLMDDRKKEVFLVEEKYTEQIALAKKYGKDVKQLEEAQKKELNALQQKFDKEDADKKKEDADKEKTRLEEEFKLREAQLNQQRANELISEDAYQLALKNLRLQYADDQVETINAEIAYTEFLNDQRDKRKEKAKEEAEAQLEYNKQIKQSWLDLGDNITNSFRQLAGVFEEGSDISKAFAITSVVIGAATSVAKINQSFAEQIADASKAVGANASIVTQGIGLLGNPFTAPVGTAMIATGTKGGIAAKALLARAKITKGLQIGSVVATSAAQIASILAAKKGSGASVSAGGGGGGEGAAPAPTFSGGVPSLATPQIQTTPGATPQTQIAATIGRAQDRPIRAYVVSQNVSSQQALDRRTNGAATFGGG